MRNFWIILLVFGLFFNPIQGFWMMGIGKSISNMFYGIYKMFDDTPVIDTQNKTSARAPAFVSKYTNQKKLDIDE